jgi:hypothetical protein
VTYAGVAYLLWHGELPNEKELDALRQQMAAARSLNSLRAPAHLGHQLWRQLIAGVGGRLSCRVTPGPLAAPTSAPR